MPEYKAPEVNNGTSIVQCSQVILVFQNRAKIVPKPLINIRQERELDEESATLGSTVLDGTIRTSTSTSRLRILIFLVLEKESI
jgi:hypothetical protein